MARYLVSAIIFVSFLAFSESQKLSVDLTLDPPELGPEPTDVELDCTYDAEENDWIIERVDWELTPAGSANPVGVFNWARGRDAASNVPKNEFKDKLDNYDSVTNSSHSMTLKDATWCNDVGMYNCYGGVTDPEVRTGDKTFDLLAHRAPGEVTVNDVVTDTDIQVDERTGTVTCCAWWNSADVTVSLTSENVTEEANGELKGDDNCTHEACVTMEYEFNDTEEGIIEFSCSVTYDGEEVDDTDVAVYYGISPTTTTEATTKAAEDGAASQTVCALLIMVPLLASFA